MRDDFSQATKDLLAERVGRRCSNPGCRQATSGPHEEPQRAVNVGVAGHITAAAPGGPRFDPTLTPQQRVAPENGIWLCAFCGRLVDADDWRFSVAGLKKWKVIAEDFARGALENRGDLTAESTTTFVKAERLMPDLLLEMRADLKAHFASAAVHPAIRVGVIAFGAAREWRERAQKEAEQMLSAITPNSAFTWTWTHRRLRDRGDTPPAFAPLSIFPFPPEDVADLILGFVDVVVRLDIARLEGAFRAAGLEARIARAPESATQFLVASRGQIGVRPPTLLREQMMNELMTPASLVRSVGSMITLREQGAVTDSDRVMIVFDNESQTWA